MKRVTEKKGFITLEAAVFLPVFMLAIISLLYYINIFSMTENVYHAAIDETSRLASKASVIKTVPAFKSELKERINGENPAIDEFKIDKFRYLYWDGYMDNMIAVDGKYSVMLDLPVWANHSYPMSVHVKCRGFTGTSKTGEPMSFEEMESEGIWDPVWIFPMSGEKYHGALCTHVKANAKEMVLTSELMKKFDPCSLCSSDSVLAGSLVYCFPENGEVYHKNSCRQIKRYAVEINKEEAIDKGYTPCSKCGGR